MGWTRGPALGHGSSAAVSIAFIDDGTIAAVKSVPLSRAAVLQLEESVLKQLPCPQIVTCLGHDITTDINDGQQQYNLFLEYVAGGSLANLLRDSCFVFSEIEVRLFARSILKGVEFVHSKGYVHCDIKPENILVMDGGGARQGKIADFGLAKRRGEKGGFFRGTPMYMSPEAVERGEYEAEMDVWAVGCVVAEMMAGGEQWRRSRLGRVWGLMTRIGGEDWTAEMIPSGLSEKGRDFLRKCFERDTEKRWTAEMLLGHTFIADVDGDDCFRRFSPRSVLSLSSPSSSCSSSSICGDFEVLENRAKERLDELSTMGETSEDWSEKGWIFVRGIISN